MSIENRPTENLSTENLPSQNVAARIIDGRAIADAALADLSVRTRQFRDETGTFLAWPPSSWERTRPRRRMYR